MFRRIQGLRLGLEERRNPFDANEDLAGQRYLFLYLTGRGEYSYLFPHTTESEIIDAAAQSIPMGSTQIWILEWVNAVRPQPGSRPKASQRRAAQALGQDHVQEGRSYALIGENARYFGWTEKLHAAHAASRLLALESAVRIAIGLLRVNVTWH